MDGNVHEIPGESAKHSLIGVNVLGELWSFLKGKIYAPYNCNLRLRISSNRYTYADAMVICGPPDCLDEHRDVVTNPTVIVEVMSPSSEAYDRGKKFEEYRTIPTLKDYLLVAQTHPAVEVYSRSDDGRWILSPYQGLDLKLSEVYDRLEFESRRDAAQDAVR